MEKNSTEQKINQDQCHKSFKKIVRIGYNRHIGNVYINIEFGQNKLSITGVEGPTPSGNCKGGCGQIDMSIDTKYINKLTLAENWTKPMIKKLIKYWKSWHLNDMNAGCVHQKEAKWDKVRIDPKELPKSHANRDKNGIIATWVTPKEHIQGLLGRKCVECGYKYGTAWLHEPVPENVLNWLYNLPDTDKTPAWV
jgi:hypothetical protein